LRLFFSTGGVDSGGIEGDLPGSGLRKVPGSGFRAESGRWLRTDSGRGLRLVSGSGTRADESGRGFLSGIGEADGRAFLSDVSGSGLRTVSGKGFRTLIVPEAEGAGEDETRGTFDPFVSLDNGR
jgi:hypothetical protein